MYYTYVLKSLNYPKFYIGYTKDLVIRLREHNEGKSAYTKGLKPWRIVYCEEYYLKTDSIKREKYFKSSAGRRWLKKIINL